jgi:putative hydrolase of the HAD superfamily
MMKIKTILFDADGVIQTTGPDFIRNLQSILTEPLNQQKADEFITDIFQAERPCLAGKADFSVELENLLKRWQIDANLEEVLLLWDTIHTLQGISELIGDLQSAGISCCLATNQQHIRAAYMQTSLGYDAMFDRQFYSYQMGVVKPDPRYFMHILDVMGLTATEVLFVDDNAQNVLAAESLDINGLVFNLADHHEPVRVLTQKLQEFSTR